MSPHAPRETIEYLRLTLGSLENETSPNADARALAELKQILLARIADLEVVDALNAESSVSEGPGDVPDATVANAPVDLPPVELVAAEQPTEEPPAKPASPPPVAD